MGCFGLDRYSGNFDVNGFFDGSCTKKSMLKVLIYLCELAEFNILENQGYFEAVTDHSSRLSGRDFTSNCCQNVDKLIKKPVLFPLDLHVSQSKPDFEYEQVIDNDKDMLLRLTKKLENFVLLKDRLQTTLHSKNFEQIEDVFLQEHQINEGHVSGIGSLDIAKIGFFSANQPIYEQNAILVKKLSKQIEQLASFDTQMFIKALYNRKFDKEVEDRSVHLEKEDVESLEKLVQITQKLKEGEFEFLKILAEENN